MRIVQLANFYGPRSGGLRTCVDALASRYAAAGHEVLLVVPGTGDEVRIAPGRTVVTIESPRVPGLGEYRAVVDLAEVRRRIADFSPDVIELSDKTTLARAVLARPVVCGGVPVPVVAVSHERLDHIVASQIRGQRLVRRVTNRWNRWFLERSAVVVCASEYAADELRRPSASSDTPIVRIPLGVDLETFCPSSGRQRASGGPPTLVYAGRLSPEKQPQRAVDTLRRLRARGVPARLVIAGSGPLEADLRRAALGLPVEFLGHVANRRVLAEVMAGADLALAPGPYETFGLAALEAMACGTPIVVPPSGALRELVALGAGMVAAPHPDGFADAAAGLLIGDRDAQRRSARERAEEFSWDRTAEAFLAVHGRLATGRRPVDPGGSPLGRIRED